MNPYFSSRLADDRLADRLAGGQGGGRQAGGRPCAGRAASGDRGPTVCHVDPAAWVLRSAAVAGAHGPAASWSGTGAGRPGPAAAPRRRVRRRAGWLLVDAGLRLAVGREAASLQG